MGVFAPGEGDACGVRQTVSGARADRLDPASVAAHLAHVADRCCRLASAPSARKNDDVLTIQIYSPAELSARVRGVLESDPLVSALAVTTGASVIPRGDVIVADVPREAANAIIERLDATGVAIAGTIHISPTPNWVSRPGLLAEQAAPGDPADAVVWAQTVQESYRQTALSWSYLSFMLLATLMASIAIILDSSILVIGAMVLGPEFGAVAALGVSLVTARFGLLRRAVVAVVAGFVIAIAIATLIVLLGRAAGFVDPAVVTAQRPGTSFIYEPGGWSILIALIAGAAGVLAMTSERTGGLVGVFISVTTIPAAGNIALALACWAPGQIIGSSAQLVINLTGMALAGWWTLLLQRRVWAWVPGIQALRGVGVRTDPRRGRRARSS